ncbi:MAG: hypothetical protein ACOX4X_00770 [Aminobacterium colombiense]|uniref:hypothetical protein n=1 Tax=Aminobacterium colombiense TaxID=81468 RepID=UPI003D9885BD
MTGSFQEVAVNDPAQDVREARISEEASIRICCYEVLEKAVTPDASVSRAKAKMNGGAGCSFRRMFVSDSFAFWRKAWCRAKKTLTEKEAKGV